MVWVPKKGATEGDVGVATRIVPDARALHFWDGTGATMQKWRQVMNAPDDAWDVYFVYGRSAKWTGDLPPVPQYWMHQLGGFGEDRYLDPDVFAAHVNKEINTR